MKDDAFPAKYAPVPARGPGSRFESLAARITPHQAQEVRQKALILLQDVLNRYTHGECTSVSRKTAAELWESTSYILDTAVGSFPSEDSAARMLGCNFRALYRQGLCLVREKHRKAARLFGSVRAAPPAAAPLCYQETLESGIPGFLRAYDAQFAAHETPGMIDYPLCFEPAGTGIGYMYEYLTYLSWENSFCGRFPAQELELLCRGFDKQYEPLLFNVYRLAADNCIGCGILGRNKPDIALRAEDCAALAALLGAMDPEKRKQTILAAADTCAQALGLSGGARAYFLREAASLAKRAALGAYNRCFTALGAASEPAQARYLDGERLPDAALRALTREIRECRYACDKIALIRRQVISAADLIDVLEAFCFFSREYDSLFDSLDEWTLAILLQRQEQASALDGLHRTRNETEWQGFFSAWLDAQPEQRRAKIRALCGMLPS